MLHSASEISITFANAAIFSILLGLIFSFAVFVASRLFARLSAAARCSLWTLVVYASVCVPLVQLGLQHAPVPSADIQGSIHATSYAVSPVIIESIFAVWFCVAVFFVLRIAAGYAVVRSTRARAYAPDKRLATLFEGVRERFGLPRSVRLLVSDSIHGPVACGFLHPAVILPATLPDALTDMQLESVLVHECSHLERCDAWNGILVEIAFAIGFVNPLVWWARRRIAIEREIACDDNVVLHRANVREYAMALAKVSLSSRAMPALGFASTASALVLRVDALMDVSRFREVGRHASAMLRAAYMVASIMALAAIPCFVHVAEESCTGIGVAPVIQLPGATRAAITASKQLPESLRPFIQ